jgi:hypothetical protein
MGPAWAMWSLIAVYAAWHAVWRLRACPDRCSWRWLFYGSAVTGLHAIASVAAWAWLNEVSFAGRGSALTYFVWVLVFAGLAGMQCRYCWGDLQRRCPVCLDRLLLPLTEGTTESVLLRPAVTETVCAHGHGVLVESRWLLRFRPQESPLNAVVHP